MQVLNSLLYCAKSLPYSARGNHRQKEEIVYCHKPELNAEDEVFGKSALNGYIYTSDKMDIL